MKTKIDWLNHGIAFFSAMLGLLVAFQLEAYQVKKMENEDLQEVITLMKGEVGSNLEIYTANTSTLPIWLEYYDICALRDNNNIIEVQASRVNALNSVGGMTPWVKIGHRIGVTDWEHRMRQVKILNPYKLPEGYSENDTILILKFENYAINTVPEFGESSSSWVAGINSGVLNRLDIDRLSKLSKIYEFTTTDKDVDYHDFYSQLDDDNLDMDYIAEKYRTIIKVQNQKLYAIKSIYESIDWSI